MNDGPVTDLVEPNTTKKTAPQTGEVGSGYVADDESETTEHEGDEEDKNIVLFETTALKILNIKIGEISETTQGLDTLINIGVVQDDGDEQVVTFHDDGVGTDVESDEEDEKSDMLALGLLVKDHEEAVQKEMVIFKGIKTFDDVIALPEKGSADKIKAIQGVLDRVAERRRALWKALGEVPAPKDEDKEGQALVKKATTAASNTDSHLPDAFAMGNLSQIRDRLATRLEALNHSTDKEKAERIENLKKGILDDRGRDITANIGDAYKRMIEPSTGKPMAQAQFYFDQAFLPQNAMLTPYEIKEGEKQRKVNDDGSYVLGGNEATDLLVAQGQKILDNGGRFADVEEMLKKTGIPRDWWPDKLLAEMQAWRKTEAALQRQRLADQYEQNKGSTPPVSPKNPISVDDVKDALQNFTGTAPDQVKNILKLIDESPEFAEKLQSALTTMSGSTDLVAGVLNFVKLAGPDDDDGVERTEDHQRSEKIDKGIEATSAYLDMLKGVYDIIADSGALDEAGKAFFQNQLIPGVALVKCGVDLVATGKSLVKHVGQKRDTGDLKTIGEQQQGEGTREDGGTMALAFENDQGAMNKLLGKDGVSMLTGVLDGAGELAGTFGGPHGKVAGVALSITSTGINLGTKAIFTGIDWSEAKRARETLQEARAGNPVARVQIFKDSNLYAKMYLVLLAKDGDKLAEQFMISKGISEENLTKSVSEKLLTQALMKESGQQSEDDVPEGLGRAMAGKLGDLADYAREAKRYLATSEYNPNWSVDDKRVALTRTSYDTIKQEAFKAGLVDINTGIGAAIGDVAKAIEAKALLGKAATDDERRSVALNIIAAIDTATSLIMKAPPPITAPLGKDGKKSRDGKPQPHKGMTTYLSALADVLRVERDRTDKRLVSDKLKNLGWTPPNKGEALDPALWVKNWQDASEKACLPKEDSGVGTALTGLKKASGEMEKAPSGGAKRLAACAAIDAFHSLAKGLESCRIAAGQIPGMQTYIMEVLKAGLEAHAEAQKQIDPGAWVPTTISSPIKPAEWNGGFQNAIENGFAESGVKYQPVAEMLSALDTAEGAVMNAPNQKAVVAAQKAHALAITDLEKALNPLRRALPPLTEAVDKVIKTAREVQTGFGKSRKEAKFNATKGVTGATWMATYSAAVEKGAVPQADRLADKLKIALDKADNSWAKFGPLATKPPFKAARERAVKTAKYLEAAISLAETVEKWPSFDNAVMKSYLKTDLIGALEKDRLKNDMMVKTLGGTLADFKLQPPTELKDKEVGSAIETAVKDGIIAAPNIDVTTWVNFFLADINELDKIKNEKDRPQKRKDELRGFISNGAKKLQNVFAGMGDGTENKEFKAYVAKLSELVKTKADEAAILAPVETLQPNTK